MKTLSATLLFLVSTLSHGSLMAADTAPEKTESQNSGAQTASPENAAMCTPDKATATRYIPSAPLPPYAEKLRTDADAVFKGPDFHDISKGKVPVPRPWLRDWFKPKAKKETSPTLPDFSVAAKILKALSVILLIAFLIWLLWRGWQWLVPQLQNQQHLSRRGKIREAQSLPLNDHNSLPDSISQSAAAAWQQGLYAQALSLLYRGAVSHLATQYQLKLPNGATEGEYLRLVRRKGPRALASSFADIVQAWSAQAYANRHPDNFAQLLKSYRQHFENTQGTKKPGGQP